MADVNAADKKSIGDPFENALQVMRMVYDFSEDGGANADQYILGDVAGDSVIMEAYTDVKTSFAGATATVQVGVTGDLDAILPDTAVASLTAGTLTDGDAASKRAALAAGDQILLNISTADLTAGKIEVVLVLAKR